MTNFKRIPLLKFLVCFVGGIVLATYANIDVEITLVFFAVVLLTTIAFHYAMIHRVRMTMHRLSSFFVLLLFFLSGVLITKAHDSRSYSNHFSASEPHQAILVRIVSQPKATAKSIGFTASIVSVRQDSGSRKTQGKPKTRPACD